MSDSDVALLNKEITDLKGKIYWKNGYGWSSGLFEELQECGWKAKKDNLGLTTIYDSQDRYIVSNIIWCYALAHLAEIMK